MLTVEKQNTNYLSYIKRLERYGCYSEQMIDEMGDAIKSCSFSMNEDSGAAYEGSMIDVVLNKLCKLAYDINEDAFGGATKLKHPGLKVNIEMLMRVLLLQHIGKAQMFLEEDEMWRKKKGFNYKFNDKLPANLKLGERSLYLCQKYGIQLSEEEYEAIRIIDKTDDSKGDAFTSPLALIVKFANTFTTIELRKEWQNKNKEENIEE
jgi:hypothetical protein